MFSFKESAPGHTVVSYALPRYGDWRNALSRRNFRFWDHVRFRGTWDLAIFRDVLLPMMGEGCVLEGIWREKTGVNVQVSGDGFGQ